MIFRGLCRIGRIPIHWIHWGPSKNAQRQKLRNEPQGCFFYLPAPISQNNLRRPLCRSFSDVQAHRTIQGSFRSADAEACKPRCSGTPMLQLREASEVQTQKPARCSDTPKLAIEGSFQSAHAKPTRCSDTPKLAIERSFQSAFSEAQKAQRHQSSNHCLFILIRKSLIQQFQV